ncbi:MAG: ABC transporter ATP-binding protein [Gammaproteobacteria bacterium]|jgi:peptide/nickel transport system ATP-binding protein|nr:ABC transporter ATP-binding protein [Gammaproteobacteria bacterium]
MMPLLHIDDLWVAYNGRGPNQPVQNMLHGISLSIQRGERVAIIGESGAGKSLLTMAIINLLQEGAFIRQGKIEFEDQVLNQLTPEALRLIRGRRIGMVFQDPMTNLNPLLTIEQQLVQCIRSHRRISYQDARTIALHKLRLVHIPAPESRLLQYPHQLSAGQRQRVTIAMALSLEPALIIADEPTSALDVTMQAEIMHLLNHLCQSNGVALLFVSHDLGLVAQHTDRSLIMYAGRIVEDGPTASLINDAQHPYTQGLIKALPQHSRPGSRLYQIPGQMPLPQQVGPGCAFAPRCPYTTERCLQQIPAPQGPGGHQASCHLLASDAAGDSHMGHTGGSL